MKISTSSPWLPKRLDEAVAIIRGISFPKDAKKKEASPESIACLRTTNVQRDVEWDDLWFVPRSYVKSDNQLVRPLDILISNANSLELVGKVAIIRDIPVEATLGTFITLFRAQSGCDPRFVYLHLASPAIQQSIRSRASTTTNISNVSTKKLAEILLHFPPLEEQRRIVGEIENQFTRLDAGVAALRRVQANLKRYRAAVLKAACEGRLVPTEADLARKEGRSFETGEQLLQRILAERRKNWKGRGKYKDPVAPSTGSHGRLPSGWAWAAWDQVGFSQNGRPFPSSAYQDSGVKLLRPGNLHVSGKVVWTDDNTRYLPRKFLDENPDLLVTGNELVMNLTAQSLKDDFLGRVCLTAADDHCLLNQRLARLSPIVISPQFALILLKAWRFRRFVDGLNSGSLIQHMFTSQLAEFTFPLPPLAEQQRIVAEVERRLSVIDELETVATANVARATRLRQSVLHQAFTQHVGVERSSIQMNRASETVATHNSTSRDPAL